MWRGGLQLGFLGGLLLAVLCGVGVAASRQATVPTEARCGLVVNGQVSQNTVIPLVDGNVYGWSMQVPGSGGEVDVVEVLTLPGPAAWAIDAPYQWQLSPDRRSCTLRMRLRPDENGMISNTWNVNSADPEGKGTCWVQIGRQRPLVFPLTFVRPHPGQEMPEPPQEAMPPQALPPVHLPSLPATRPATSPSLTAEQLQLKALDQKIRAIEGQRAEEILPRPTTSPTP